MIKFLKSVAAQSKENKLVIQIGFFESLGLEPAMFFISISYFDIKENPICATFVCLTKPTQRMIRRYKKRFFKNYLFEKNRFFSKPCWSGDYE